MYTMYSTNCNLIYFYRRWSMEKFKLPNINEEKTLLKTKGIRRISQKNRLINK